MRFWRNLRRPAGPAERRATCVLSACGFALEIPQYGMKHSLNVSVAFGIAAYALIDRLPRSAGGSA